MQRPTQDAHNHARTVSRRQFMALAATGSILPAVPSAATRAAARAAAQEAVPTVAPTRPIAGTALHILQWAHVISEYDFWFQQFAQQWGAQNQVAITIDFVDSATIPNALKTELAEGAGHDIIEHIAPLPMHGDRLVDLTDLMNEATARHGPPLDFCRLDGFDSQTNRQFGFVHGYAPLAVNFRPSLWTTLGMPNGPESWGDLGNGAVQIWNDLGIQLGLGLSDDLDSNTAALTALWAHGASVQDESGAITINSDESIQVVDRFRRFYQACMTPAVFEWDIRSNNQLMIDGQASAILNALSAYRGAQGQKPEVAKDFAFRAPLRGLPTAYGPIAPAHARFTAMIPAFSPNQDTAREFLLALVGSYEQATTASKLYNFPAFASTVPLLKQDGGLLDNDPAYPDQGPRLSPFKNANSWTVQLGWPGQSSALIGAAIDQSILSQMMARAARGELTPRAAVIEAENRLQALAAGQ